MEDELSESELDSYIDRQVTVVGQVASCVFRSRLGVHDIKLVHGDSWFKVILRSKAKVGSVVRISGGTLSARNIVNAENSDVRELKPENNDYDNLLFNCVRSAKRVHILGTPTTGGVNRVKVRVTSIRQLSESNTELGLQIGDKNLTAQCRNFKRKEIDQAFGLGRELSLNVSPEGSSIVIDKASNPNLFGGSQSEVKHKEVKGLYSILALTNNKFPPCVVKVRGTMVGYTPSDLGDWFESEAFVLVISDESNMRLRVRFGLLPDTIGKLRSQDALRAKLVELGTAPHVYQCRISTVRRDMEYSMKIEGLDIEESETH